MSGPTPQSVENEMGSVEVIIRQPNADISRLAQQVIDLENAVRKINLQLRDMPGETNDR